VKIADAYVELSVNMAKFQEDLKPAMAILEETLDALAGKWADKWASLQSAVGDVGTAVGGFPLGDLRKADEAIEKTEEQKKALEILSKIAGEYGAMQTDLLEEIAEAAKEPIEMTEAQKKAIVELQEKAEEYGRTQTDVMESVAVLDRGALETTEMRQKALEILTKIAGEYGGRQTDIMESLAGKQQEAIKGTQEQQLEVKTLTEAAELYGRTQTDIMESVAYLEETAIEKTEEHRKAVEDLADAYSGSGLASSLEKAYEAMGKLGEEIKKAVPESVEFEIIGKLKMPVIPKIPDVFFNIIGIWVIPPMPKIATPEISLPKVEVPSMKVPEYTLPSFQFGGLVSKTGLAKVERGEKITPAGKRESNINLTVNFQPGSKFTEVEKSEIRKFFYDKILPLIQEAKGRQIGD